MKAVAFDGQYVRLEPLTLGHLSDLERGFDPSLFDFYPKPYTTAREFVEENLEMLKQGNYRPFAIIEKSTGECVGCTEFSGIDEKNRRLEIGGSWLKPSRHGSPLNSEAKYLLLEYAFEVLTFVRVQFTANALNALSRAGIEKIGAQFEGVTRNAMILPDGKLRDDATYSIISSEWPHVKSALKKRIQLKAKNESLTQMDQAHAPNS
jgi:RimJ/RimL family protein N-acetyltransferase